MWHVDEGALHAYLDGALDEFPADEAERVRRHLDACTECQVALEEARGLRTDAHAMLGLAAPVVEAPSFEELRAYVQRTRARGAGMSRLQRMGWAASVVLALGAGWMLRGGPVPMAQPELQMRPASDVGGPAATVGRTATEPARERDAAAAEEFDAFAEGVTTFADRGVGAEAPTLEEESAPLEQMVGPGGIDSKVTELVAQVPADLVASVPAESAATVSTEGSASADERQRVDFRTMNAETAVAAADAGALANARVDAVDTAGARRLEAEAAGAGVVSPTSAPPAATEPAPAEAAERRRAAEPVVSALRSAPAAPSAEDRPDADADDAALREAQLAVAGHEVISVTNLGSGTTPWGVRVVQRLEDGRVFEVVHLEPGVDPAILPDPPDGGGEAATETANGWVMVRGGLPEAELQALLARLFTDGG